MKAHTAAVGVLVLTGTMRHQLECDLQCVAHGNMKECVVVYQTTHERSWRRQDIVMMPADRQTDRKFGTNSAQAGR